ncbi:MAG: hypothetical protein U0871_01670 [Gemmataceae bacterium]
MASGKRKRKELKAAKGAGQPKSAVYRHPDGDRRHRGGMTADQGQKDKKARREFWGVPAELPEPKPQA